MAYIAQCIVAAEVNDDIIEHSMPYKEAILSLYSCIPPGDCGGVGYEGCSFDADLRGGPAGGCTKATPRRAVHAGADAGGQAATAGLPAKRGTEEGVSRSLFLSQHTRNPVCGRIACPHHIGSCIGHWR